MKLCKLTDENLQKISGNTLQKYHKKFNVTITEKLQMVVTVEAANRDEAEQIVSENWKNSEYVLDADNFVDVEFVAVPASGQDN